MADKLKSPTSTNSNKDPIKAAVDSNPCGACRAMGFPGCKGHGASGGGGSDGGETKNEKTGFKPNNVMHAPGQAVSTSTSALDKAKAIWIESQLLSNTINNYEAGLLLIESDRLRGDLSIKVKPGLSKMEEGIAREFLKTLKAEFDEFKNQLAEQGVSTSGFSAALKGNELSVHIPNQKYYGAFIKQLESKNLLPVPNQEREEKRETLNTGKEDKKQRFNPTPFSTRLEKK